MVRGLDLIISVLFTSTSCLSCVLVLTQYLLLQAARWVSTGISIATHSRQNVSFPATTSPSVCARTCTPCCCKMDQSPHSCQEKPEHYPNFLPSILSWTAKQSKPVHFPQQVFLVSGLVSVPSLQSPLPLLSLSSLHNISIKGKGSIAQV